MSGNECYTELEEMSPLPLGIIMQMNSIFWLGNVFFEKARKKILAADLVTGKQSEICYVSTEMATSVSCFCLCMCVCACARAHTQAYVYAHVTRWARICWHFSAFGLICLPRCPDHAERLL